MIRPGAFALALALAIPSLAAPVSAAAADSRLIKLPYNANEVYRLEGRTKVQTTIRFAPDETIQNVAIGDSSAWQVTPNKGADLLFVKPIQAHAATNMTVVTNKRTYLFDLVASPRGTPVYVMSFSYSDVPAKKPDADAQLADQTTQAERAAANDDLAVLDPSKLNFAWTKTGDKALLPKNVFDNGVSTFLTWPQDQPVPAILVTNDKGIEGPVNFTVRGNTIVVDGVPKQIVLRSGKDRAVLAEAGPRRQSREARANTALASRAEDK